MNSLSREARALIAAGKSELRPSLVDRKRVTRSLRDRMGAVGLTLSIPAKAAPGVVAGKAFKLLAVAGTLGIVGALSAVVYFGRQGKHAAVPPQNAIPAQPPLTEEPVPSRPIETSEPLAPQAVSSNPSMAEPPPRTAKPPRDSLGEEVQILSRAERELHNGRPALALKALDEHQRRFASGALVQERSAARVQALCALGRLQEAKLESIKLKRSSPNSPQAAQMSSPCESKP